MQIKTTFEITTSIGKLKNRQHIPLVRLQERDTFIYSSGLQNATTIKERKLPMLTKSIYPLILWLAIPLQGLHSKEKGSKIWVHKCLSLFSVIFVIMEKTRNCPNAINRGTIKITIVRALDGVLYNCKKGMRKAAAAHFIYLFIYFAILYLPIKPLATILIALFTVIPRHTHA